MRKCDVDAPWPVAFWAGAGHRLWNQQGTLMLLVEPARQLSGAAGKQEQC